MAFASWPASGARAFADLAGGGVEYITQLAGSSFSWFGEPEGYGERHGDAEREGEADSFKY